MKKIGMKKAKHTDKFVHTSRPNMRNGYPKHIN